MGFSSDARSWRCRTEQGYTDTSVEYWDRYRGEYSTCTHKIHAENVTLIAVVMFVSDNFVKFVFVQLSNLLDPHVLKKHAKKYCSNNRTPVVEKKFK